jgi:hypothetical protein
LSFPKQCCFALASAVKRADLVLKRVLLECCVALAPPVKPAGACWKLMMGAQEAQGSTLEVCGEVLLIVEIELKREGLLLRLLLLFITAKQNRTGTMK